ncbi:MAG: universal stress protein [Gammaproteobacteria bacterium]|nr:universal stress protein [Gammaproteobacteria bacterium]
MKGHDDKSIPLPKYNHVLLAVDSSDHSNRSLLDAIQLASIWHTDITATHVYAAKLHDVRFRQMEGGLPKQFREEHELEKQRDVHDDLIGRGLSIITDSYLDHAERQCQQARLSFKRCSLEGKNYRELAQETNSGRYDLLVMGALGLGAVQGSRVGTVCQRVVRRSDIDTLVIKEPKRSIAEGPIVVAIDGSTKAYGGLLTALSLAQQWQVPVKVIAAFDPYFHYVAFNRIADVLSEEAGKVFRFQEQEKLHEKIIDSGLAKIYQGHLDVAKSIANDYILKTNTVKTKGFKTRGLKIAVEIETKLLDGKPHDAIEKYLKAINPSLLIIGKLGIHADAKLDIGGTSENLLHNTTCALLLSQREFQPQIDLVAETTTSWTTQATERINKVPEFVRNMARMTILRYAQEKGHTVITKRIVDDATAQLCPSHAKQAMAEIVATHDAKKQGRSLKIKKPEPMRWSRQATKLLANIDNLAVRGNLMMRAEKKARQAASIKVEISHVSPFIKANQSCLIPQPITTEQHWQAAALAHLARVPEGFMRDTSRQHIEDYARQQGISNISLAIATAGLEQVGNTMQTANNPAQSSVNSKCPFGHDAKPLANNRKIAWNDAAQARMKKVPVGFMRNLTRQRIETFAQHKGVTEITPALIDEKYREWRDGAEKQQRLLIWTTDALQRIERIPDFVRGMAIKEVERCAQQQGEDTVTADTIGLAMKHWKGMGAFHSDANPGLYSGLTAKTLNSS